MEDPHASARVNQVGTTAEIDRSQLLPEEIAYIREHALHKPLHVTHVWALGVGVVITGEYFGWNFGLPIGGPVGVLVASLIVCVLYLAWVLALSELAVAMPFAGGPLAFGRRAVGKWFGFLMGFSMFLECLFATIGTGLAAGGYIAFLINPDQPSRIVATVFAIACTLIFFVIQYTGVKQQAVIMVWLTYAAIGALVWFWLGTAPGVSLDRVFSKPLLPWGWSGVLSAIPYALWWLVIIESVALASEEAHEPHVSIPRGLVLAQITLVVLVLLTWFFACAAAPFAKTGAVDYPLPLVFKEVWGSGWFLSAFSAVAVAGMIVSYNGMIYATSRQSFSLGRAGYLPQALGRVHRTRRTPHVSLAVWTCVAILFIIFGHFYVKATAVAILISTLTAVIWYVLAMVSLIVLRRKEAALLRPYKVPVYPAIPIFVAVLSGIAGYLYIGSNIQVILPTIALYVAAGLWYSLWARKKVLAVAPEEVAARIAEEMASKEIARVDTNQTTPISPVGAILSRATAILLGVGVLSLFWMILRARGVVGILFSETLELTLVIALWALLFLLLSAVGLASTRKQAKLEN